MTGERSDFGQDDTPQQAQTAFVEIVAPPTGQAPLWVREGWVGLVVPLAQDSLQDVPTVAVSSGGRLGQLAARLLGRTEMNRGYLVQSKAAITLLAATNVEAARWWCENAPGLIRDDRQMLFFNEAACQRGQLAT